MKKVLKLLCVLVFLHLIFKIILGPANTPSNTDIKYVSFFVLIKKLYSHMKWSIDVKKGVIDEADAENYSFSL